MSPDDRDATWFVLIEQTLDGTGTRHWSAAELVPAGSYEEALKVGRETAFTHRPQHPKSPRRRSVFQAGDDSWIVVVHGATTAFHFRVSVVRWLGDAPQ